MSLRFFPSSGNSAPVFGRGPKGMAIFLKSADKDITNDVSMACLIAAVGGSVN